MISHPSQILHDYGTQVIKEQGCYVIPSFPGSGKTTALSSLMSSLYPKNYEHIVYIVPRIVLREEMKKAIANKIINSEDSVISQDQIITIASISDHIAEIFETASDESIKYIESVTKLLSSIEKVLSPLTPSHSVKQQLKKLEQIKATLPDHEKKLYALQDAAKCLNRDKNYAEVYEFHKADDERKIRETEQQFRKTVKRIMGLLSFCIKSGTLDESFRKAYKDSLLFLYPEVYLAEKKIIMISAQKLVLGFDRHLCGISDLNELAGPNLFIFDESDACYTSMADVIINTALGNQKTRLYTLAYTLQQFAHSVKLDKSFIFYSQYYKSKNNIASYIPKAISKLFSPAELFPNIKIVKNPEIDRENRYALFRSPSFVGSTASLYNYFYKVRNIRKSSHLEITPSSLAVNSKTPTLNELILTLTDILYYATGQFFDPIMKLQDLRRNPNITIEESLQDEKIESCVHRVCNMSNDILEKFSKHLIEVYYANRKRIYSKMSITENSLYSSGISITSLENVDSYDPEFHDLYTTRISTTPEKILLSLLYPAEKKKIEQEEELEEVSDIIFPKNSVILCSATALLPCLKNNFSIPYLKRILGKYFHTPSKSFYVDIQKANSLLYHPDRPTPQCIVISNLIKEEDIKEYETLCPDIIKCYLHEKFQTIADIWYNQVKNEYIIRSKKGPEIDLFNLNRLLKFIQVYHQVITTEDINTCLYFENKFVSDKQRIYHLTAGLIDGTYPLNGLEQIGRFDKDYVNKNLLFTKSADQINEKSESYCKSGKRGKLFVVTCYQSLSSGVNLQMRIIGSEALYRSPYLNEDKMDWDSIYVARPRNYWPKYQEDDKESPSDPFNVKRYMLLARLYEEGQINYNDFKTSVLEYKADYPQNSKLLALSDQIYFVLGILEQAVGRISRTHSKGSNTTIFWDSEICNEKFPTWKQVDFSRAYTPEFTSLLIAFQKYGEAYNTPSLETLFDEMSSNSLINKDGNLKRSLQYRLDVAFKMRENTYSQKDSIKSQKLLINYAEYLVRHPKPVSMEAVPTHVTPELQSSYAEMQDSCVSAKIGERTVCPQNARLDIMAKNEIIARYFSDNNIPLEWEPSKITMLPVAFNNHYKGRIGEYALIAILEHYGIKTKSIPPGLNYERADIITEDERFAFDAKNYNPSAPSPIDYEVGQKEYENASILNVKIYFVVNILPYPGIKPIDHPDTRIILVNGIIDEYGRVLESNMQKIINLIESNNEHPSTKTS